jgi:hypothetical protein
MTGVCVVIADHQHDDFLTDLVTTLKVFVPAADIAIYNSGEPRALQRHPVSRSAILLPATRKLAYAKVTPFFFDMFEWASGQPYDYVVNAETDMAWIKPGFEGFLATAMAGFDYMAAAFKRDTPSSSRWRPYRSLLPELAELRGILGRSGTHQAFSPGQVFSAKYIRSLLDSAFYEELRAFVERNQALDRSFTLQEVLMPTLADVLGLPIREYPPHLATFNRYRPYHAAKSVHRAATVADAYFVHPVRRQHDDPARMTVRRLVGSAFAGEEGQ